MFKVPVHPVHKVLEFALLGADSAEGAKYAKPFIHAHLDLIGLKINEMRKMG